MKLHDLIQALYSNGTLYDCLDEMRLADIRKLHAVIRTAVREKICLLEAQGEIVQRMREENFA